MATWKAIEGGSRITPKTSIKYSIKFSFFAIIAFASPPNPTSKPLKKSSGSQADARQLGVVRFFFLRGEHNDDYLWHFATFSNEVSLPIFDFCSAVTQLPKTNLMFNRYNNILLFFFIVTLNVGQIVFAYLPKKWHRKRESAREGAIEKTLVHTFLSRFFLGGNEKHRERRKPNDFT